MKPKSVFDCIVEEFNPPAPKPAPKPAPTYDGPVYAQSRRAGKSAQADIEDALKYGQSVTMASQFRAPITCIDASMLISDDVLAFDKAEVESVMRRELLTQIVNKLMPEMELRTEDDPRRMARLVAMRLHVILPKHFKGVGDSIIFPTYRSISMDEFRQ